MNNPKITVVTVCYNAAETIEDTILSVINQTYDNIEYIIIDGVSTDSTVDIIKKYTNRITKWVSEPDNGIYDAMNKGIKMATGKWINFMNAGDLFFNDYVVSEVVNRIEGNPSFIFGDTVVTTYGIECHLKAKPFYEKLPLHRSSGFIHQSSFVRSDIAKIFPFDLKYELAADYNMIIEIYRKGGSFFQLKDLIISKYDGNGVSAQKKKQHIQETLSVDNPQRKHLNIIIGFYYYYKYKLKELLKQVIYFFSPSLIIGRYKKLN